MSEILIQDLGMKRVVAKVVPRLLLPKQKEHQVSIADDLIQTTTNKPNVGPKVHTLKGTGVSLSYVQCFLYLVSSSKKVSVFHSMWLDTFRTDLIVSSRGFLLPNQDRNPNDVACKWSEASLV